MRIHPVYGLLATLVLTCGSIAAEDGEARWWPKQKPPRAVVRATIHVEIESSDQAPYYSGAIDSGPVHMLVESLSGLAAKAVNERRNDEMVWIATSNPDFEDWYVHALRRLNLEVRGELSPWDLAERLARRGVVKGYILYRHDKSAGEVNDHRPGMDLSINVATSMASVLDAAVVDESLEPEAKARGLEMLFDARDQTQQWVFEQYRDRFNRRMLCTQDPQKPHVRDMAIAQQAFTLYGYDEPAVSVMAWLEPLSPVLGWNGGDEYETTIMTSLYGHIQTATDWCMNLPLLMAASENAHISQPRHLDPRRIDWNDKRHATSFVITDGDNVQWYMGGLMRAQGDSWYGNPLRGRFPYGWSSCFAHLVQLCPETVSYAVGTQSANDEFIEWGGGYFYPDVFAAKRPNPEELMAQHARRTWAHMKKTGTRIIAFNFSKFDTDATRRVCEIYAREMDGLLGIMAFQYAPYEGGAGRIHWVQNRRGEEVPVVSTRYSIWEHSNERPRSGTPAKVAREIRETVAEAEKQGRQNLDWVITHAWSYFKYAPGADEDAENMEQKDAPKKGGVRGYAPVVWCVDRLPDNVRAVLPEELLWRIRMEHNPDQTRAFIERWKPGFDAPGQP